MSNGAETSNGVDLEQLSTIEETQRVLDADLRRAKELLARPNRSGESLDNFETLPTDLEQVLERLSYVLYHLPQDVQAVSIGFKFEAVAAPQNNRQQELRTLQQLLNAVGITDKNGVFESELTVRKPFVPEELERISHGSEARSLARDVVETLKNSRSSELNVFLVKPHGKADGTSRIEVLNAIDFRIPLAQVTHIKLETDRKNLTPWVEHDGQGGFTIKPVTWPSDS